MFGGMFQGAMMHGGITAENWNDPETTSFVTLNIPSDNFDFYCTTIGRVVGCEESIKIDWGDGSAIEEFDEIVYTLSGAEFAYHTSSTLADRIYLKHTFAHAGVYTVRTRNSVGLFCSASYIASQNTVTSMKWQRIDLNVTGTMPIASAAALSRGYINLSFYDISRFYNDSSPTGLNTPRGSATYCKTSLKEVWVPKKCTFIGGGNFSTAGNPALERIVFTGHTMAQIRQLKTSSSGSVLWNFQGVVTTCVIIATDGEIRNVGGTWTDYPSNL